MYGGIITHLLASINVRMMRFYAWERAREAERRLAIGKHEPFVVHADRLVCKQEPVTPAHNYDALSSSDRRVNRGGAVLIELAGIP